MELRFLNHGDRASVFKSRLRYRICQNKSRNRGYTDGHHEIVFISLLSLLNGLFDERQALYNLSTIPLTAAGFSSVQALGLSTIRLVIFSVTSFLALTPSKVARIGRQCLTYHSYFLGTVLMSQPLAYPRIVSRMMSRAPASPVTDSGTSKNRSPRTVCPGWISRDHCRPPMGSSQ